MKRFENDTPTRLYILIAATLGAALAVEAVTPLGVAEWVIYLVPVVLTVYATRRQVPLLVAAIATVCIGAGIVVSPGEDVSSALPYINRAMIIAAIWIVALVARQLIGARIDLRQRDWIRSGQRDLAVRMQGNLGVQELGDNIVTFLCNYLGVPVGALYVAEPDGMFRRLSGYAADGAGAAGERRRIASGEGLLGQAVKDRQILTLDPAPQGYLDVSSALGRAKPARVIAVPALADGDVVGAIEFGFLEAVGSSEMRLLEAVAEPIAVAIRGSLYRGRLEELLRETQRQAEALQRQQEELRVQNEELENQSDALRESEARLEAQQAELEQTNTQLEEQANMLEHQRDELARSQRRLLEHSHELARANAYKSEFLANMSHELRTPLNSALILAKVLADNKDGNLTAQQVKFASTIYTSGNDLLELINEILDLSRIEAGALELHPAEIEIERIVEPVARTFQPVATQKGLSIEVRLDPRLPGHMFTDRLRLQQILRNLLGNALKFTESGSVKLEVSPQGGDQVAFAVVDTGPGIPAEQQEVIFEAFRQADGTTQRKHGGTGLGLTISRQLAQRLGGDIAVESVPRQGSTFTLTVPVRLSAAALEAAAEPAAAPVSSGSTRDGTDAAGRRSARAESGRGAAGEHGDAAADASKARKAGPGSAAAGVGGTGVGGTGVGDSGVGDTGVGGTGGGVGSDVDDDRGRAAAGTKSVLVIEDDARFAAILRDLARERGFRCLVARSADEGVDLAERYQPSGVVLDIGLPDASGLSVLEHLKAHPATRHIPIHVVSATDHTQQALELGAVGYAVKPVGRDELVAALSKLEQKVEQERRRVLVVEDVEAQRESLVALLSADDVEIVAVATAEEALERLRETTFDCMVLDLTLSGASGYELLDQMATGESFSFPPVIVYTGRTLSRDEEQHLRRYASSIVIKGARSPERLLDEVTLFLHQVEAHLPQEKQRMLREVRSRDSVLEQRSILLAEDDARNIFALASVLEPKGVTLHVARNGKEALAALERAGQNHETRIDLVLMDVMMPEMDGLTAMREIRSRSEWQKLPVIALTAKTMPDDREKCLEAGANDYIAKPLDVDKLLSLIKVWMPK